MEDIIENLKENIDSAEWQITKKTEEIKELEKSIDIWKQALELFKQLEN